MEIAMVNLLMDGMTEYLIQKLYTEPEDLKVATIRPGRLQDDPTKLNGFNILIGTEFETERSRLATPTSDGTISGYPYEIGGGVMLWNTFTVDMIFHFKGEKVRDTARTKAMILMSRLKHALLSMPMPLHPDTGQPQDDFGETLLMLEIGQHFLRESGGPSHFIWKGELNFKVLTQISPLSL